MFPRFQRLQSFKCCPCTLYSYPYCAKAPKFLPIPAQLMSHPRLLRFLVASYEPPSALIGGACADAGRAGTRRRPGGAPDLHTRGPGRLGAGDPLQRTSWARGARSHSAGSIRDCLSAAGRAGGASKSRRLGVRVRELRARARPRGVMRAADSEPLSDAAAETRCCSRAQCTRLRTLERDRRAVGVPASIRGRETRRRPRTRRDCLRVCASSAARADLPSTPRFYRCLYHQYLHLQVTAAAIRLYPSLPHGWFVKTRAQTMTLRNQNRDTDRPAPGTLNRLWMIIAGPGMARLRAAVTTSARRTPSGGPARPSNIAEVALHAAFWATRRPAADRGSPRGIAAGGRNLVRVERGNYAGVEGMSRSDSPTALSMRIEFRRCSPFTACEPTGSPVLGIKGMPRPSGQVS